MNGWVLSLLIFLLLSVDLKAQKLRTLSSNDRFTEYELINDSLNLDLPFEFTAYQGDHPAFEVLSREVQKVDITKLGYQSNSWSELLSTVYPESHRDTPLIEVLNPGRLRGNRAVSIKIHVMRPADSQSAQILRYLRFRIYDQPFDKRRERRITTAVEPNEPFSEGNWYKIPIIKSDLYQIDRDYLTELGLNPDELNPKNIQLWGMSPDPLPHPNNVARPQLQEIPVLHEGTSDNAMETGDRLLFYASSTHRLIWNDDQNRFNHRIHPYSDTSFVYLTVGSNPGLSANPLDYSNQPIEDQHSSFEDIRWLEEELHKPEEDLKSGLEWLGNALERNSSTVVFRDTLSGLTSTASIRLETQVAARSTQANFIDVRVNGQSAGTLTPPGISSYTSAEGFAARTDRLTQDLTVSVNNGVVEVTMQYQSGDGGAKAWVDWVRLRATRPLTARNGELLYQSTDNGSTGSIHQYNLSGFDSTPYVMDITNPISPIWLQASTSGNSFTTHGSGEPGHLFFASTEPKTPEMGRAIANQNITQLTTYPDYIIITDRTLLSEAQSWADYRTQTNQLTPVVVTQTEIFNAFSGGIPDVAALRDYIRFLDQRAIADNATRPAHLLLFGDTSFDYKNILGETTRDNLVFTYQSRESYSRVSSYGSDDFFGLLDDTEGQWESSDTSERLDIGIGRLPVDSPAEAQAVLDKWKRYESPEGLGDWRSLFTFAADDDISGSSNDRDLHTLNAEGTANRMDQQSAGIRFNKIYELSYPAEYTSQGRRMPAANQDFIRAINRGTLVINYSGHGAEEVLSAERLFTGQQVSQLTNRNRPTIFVTATCSFGRYDDPSAQSGAEKLVLWAEGGAAAAFTTTRVVYTSSTPTSSNFGLNIQLSQQMLERESNGQPQRLGDIYRNTKNTSVGASFNSRKFILLGDPAMRIGLPRNRTLVSDINNTQIADLPPDSILTLPSLAKMSVGGLVQDQNQNTLPDFQGEAQFTVLDANRYVSYSDKSWAPSCYLPQCQYRVQNDRLFNGTLSVQNAQFNAEFIIPEDISYSDTTGRILVYAHSTNGLSDAIGSFERIRFNGVNPNPNEDSEGPKMDVYLNDQQFVNGALVNDQPTLIVDIFDESGINTTGNGIGHEIIATIDTEPETRIVLNDYYQSEIDSYQEGRIEYPVESLPEGDYQMQVEAWDVYNNPAQQGIQFTVADSQELSVRNVFNYPNPMHKATEFVFEHNQPGQLLYVEIRIFTLSGRPVDLLKKQLVTGGTLGRIPWDGRVQGKKLATGTYLYHIRIKADTPMGTQQFEKIEKLVILN